MLRRKNFRPFEIAILRAIAFLLFGAGVVGVFLALHRGNWRVALTSAGALILAAIYLRAARRGNPL
jgi:hypothetical protein